MAMNERIELTLLSRAKLGKLGVRLLSQVARPASKISFQAWDPLP